MEPLVQLVLSDRREKSDLKVSQVIRVKPELLAPLDLRVM